MKKQSINMSSVRTRRELFEQTVHVPLPTIGAYTLDEDIASTRHCENMIGTVHVPLGIAGPLLYKTVSSSRVESVYIPLATTEGALVASVNRGCKAIRESGGARVESQVIGVTRGPVFFVNTLQEGNRFRAFLHAHMKAMQEVIQTTSKHIHLKNLTVHSVGNYHYVRFLFDTSDAMGLNMVTIATDAIVTYITQQTGVKCIALSGNFCVDKKPSWLNTIEGRGSKIWAEVVLPEHVLQLTLKTTAQRMYDVWMAKCMMGSMMSGSMGSNAHVANVLAAIFLATGQDVAHIVECSVGMTTATVRGTDLYMSIYLPDVMVGTVGGGTELGSQKESLSICGVYGGNDGKNKQKFTEIIAAAVLAGEISLIASLSEGSLATAHKKLARGKRI